MIHNTVGYKVTMDHLYLFCASVFKICFWTCIIFIRVIKLGGNMYTKIKHDSLLVELWMIFFSLLCIVQTFSNLVPNLLPQTHFLPFIPLLLPRPTPCFSTELLTVPESSLSIALYLYNCYFLRIKWGFFCSSAW